MRAAAATVAERMPAAAAVAADARAGWTDTLRQAGEAVAFGCGLELLSPMDVEVTSPTLQRERLSGCSGRPPSGGRPTRSAISPGPPSCSSSGPSWPRRSRRPRLARCFSNWPPPTAGPCSTRCSWPAAGPRRRRRCGPSPGRTWSGPTWPGPTWPSTPPTPELHELPTTVGPLRSVRCEDGRLLIGGRNRRPAGRPRPPPAAAEAYLAPGLSTDHGFTAATLAGGKHAPGRPPRRRRRHLGRRPSRRAEFDPDPRRPGRQPALPPSAGPTAPACSPSATGWSSSTRSATSRRSWPRRPRSSPC